MPAGALRPPEARVPEQRVLSRVSESGAFQEGIKWTQRSYIYRTACDLLNKMLQDGVARPVAVYAGRYYWVRGRLVVGTGFYSVIGRGDARVAVQEKDGTVSLLRDANGNPVIVHSIEEGRRKAEDTGKQLADATILLNSGFMEANRGWVIVFSTGNAQELGIKNFEKGYYLAVARQDGIVIPTDKFDAAKSAVRKAAPNLNPELLSELKAVFGE